MREVAFPIDFFFSILPFVFYTGTFERPHIALHLVRISFHVSISMLLGPVILLVHFPALATATATSLAPHHWAIAPRHLKGCCFGCSSPSAARTWHVHVHTRTTRCPVPSSLEDGLGIR